MTACPPTATDWRLFENWCLHGRLPAERPKGLRKQVPTAWFTCFRQLHPKPAPKPALDYGLFSRSVAFVANPGSGYEGEKLGALKTAGWMVALNVAAQGNETWRVPAHNLGVPVIPWMQVRKPADVAELVATADDWDSPGLVVNLEKESETTCTPAQVALDLPLFGQAAILTSPWAEPDANWQPLNRYVTASECFMNSNAGYTPNTIYDHLANLGFTRTLACYGVGKWADAPFPVTPEQYAANNRHPERPHWIWNLDQLTPWELAQWLT